MELVVHTTAETGMSIVPMGKYEEGKQPPHSSCDVFMGGL